MHTFGCPSCQNMELCGSCLDTLNHNCSSLAPKCDFCSNIAINNCMECGQFYCEHHDGGGSCCVDCRNPITENICEFDGCTDTDTVSCVMCGKKYCSEHMDGCSVCSEFLCIDCVDKEHKHPGQCIEPGCKNDSVGACYYC